MAAFGAFLRYSRASTKGTLLLPQHFSLAFFSSSCKINYHHSPPPIQAPPAAKKVPFTEAAHGITWQDPYHWMSNTSDPDFVSYLHQENSYAEAFMQDTQALQSKLYNEMVSRMPSKISTPPERWGPWLYYQYIPEGKEYPVLCRKSSTGTKGWVNSMVNSFREVFGNEQILLDWNDIAEQYGYVHVGTCRISPDHNFLAYTLDTTGDEQFLLQIKDLQSDVILPNSGVEGVVSLAWAQDARTLFYTLCNENQRPYRVMCTKLGSNSADDVTIFTENDSNFCVDITSTKDGKFVTVNSNSRTSSEEGIHLVYVINVMDLNAGLQRFCERVPGVQYFLEHHCGYFYILTNAPMNDDDKFSGDGYYLARCRVEDAQSANLQNVIMPGDGTYVEDMDIFNGHLVLFLNKDGSPSICSIDLPIETDGKKLLEINDLNPWFFPMPSKMCTIAPGSNHDFMSSVYRVVLSSPVMPDLIVDYDMSRKVFSIVQQEDVTDISSPNYSLSSDKPLHFPIEKDERGQNNEIRQWRDLSEKYSCEEEEIVSHDGVKIPLTLMFSKSAYQKGQSPGILYGYGAYGEVVDKSWCPDRLSLLDRGWLLAFADVRGGGGSDPSWHKSGCRLSKLNSIYDFISCGKYLINESIIHREKLGAIGVSAGCILVGAAINMHPGLFRAAILEVPFLDVINTLLDPSLPLTTLDYEEFGNPQIRSYFEYIRKYSPYDNIPQRVCCPSMLVSASFNDSRVGVWEAAKWVAKIRDSACLWCSSSVILKTNMSGGHFREGGRFAQCLETAYDYAFLMRVMEK